MDYMQACEWLHLDPERVIDEDKLKRAFRKSAIREHPDKSSHDDATKRFQSVKRAHTFLEQCVERGETGPHADLDRTDDHDEEDDDDDHVDIFEHFMAHVYVSHLQHQMRAHMGGGGGGVPHFGMRFRAGRYPDDDDDDYEDDVEDDAYYDYDDESYDEEDEDDEDYRYGNSRRRQEEQAQREERKRKEMERKRQQAMKEGREFFESWSVKQLQQEAGRRGFNTKGLQQESLVELLIEDEAKKRKKRELKTKAPLVAEWVEIIGVTSQPHLNGMKARAIDFSEDRYTVEWEDPSLKKKSPQYRHMYGEKKKARFKPENIKLWGSVTPTAEPEQKQEEASEEQFQKGKKSRRARRKAAKKRQQEQQQKQQQEEEHQEKDQKLSPDEKSNDTKKRNIGGFSCTHKVTNLMGQNNQQNTEQNNNNCSSKRERDGDDMSSDPRLDRNSDDNDDDEFDDLPDLVTKPAPGNKKKPQQDQETNGTQQPTKPIFGSTIFGKDSQSNGSKDAPMFSLGSGISSKKPDVTKPKRPNNCNSNKEETGPTTPWTTPMFGATTDATSAFTFGGDDQKEPPNSPSFGSSSTFKFGGSDSSKQDGEKSAFKFGSTNQVDQGNQEKEHVKGEKKSDNSSLKTSEKKESETLPKTNKPAEDTKKSPESNKKATNQSQSAAPTNLPKATGKPNIKVPSDKTMDQFERLAKELGDKVDLTDDITGLQSLYNDGYIQHKVKCPKNKKPGDFIEFTNPHIKGQKQRVQIPAGVKPEKFFKVLVPLPKAEVEPTLHCACCMKVVKKEASGEENKEADEIEDADDIGVPLRACAHYCCKVCHTELGKTCPSCKTPLPTIESLDPLPFIEDLDNPSDVVKKALLEEYYSKKEADRLDTKEAKDRLDESSEAATKAVDKHYRRASLKVHPDRFGEKFRKEFNALTKARDVFRNNELRRKYLIEMLDIVCRVDIGYIGQSHQIWIEKNDPDLQEKSSKPASSSNKPGPEAPLQLDGGVAFSRPKRPRIFIQSEKAKRLKLYLPLVNEYQFLEYCKKVFVYGNCGHIDEQNIILADIKRSKLNIIDGQIRCEVELPDNGIWDISWSAWLEMDGKEGATPTSTGAKVDLRDASQRSMEQRKLAMERLALRSTNDIKSRLRSAKVIGAGDRHKIEESNNSLHPVIARGRDISTKLAELLRGTGETSSASLVALLDCLQEAVDYKGQLEISLKTYGKRDARRAFKETVANKLERGDAEKWVASVSEDDLKALSGDSNRLYQLLIEGKKANSLAFNDTTIESAENRTDLFTAKQIEALKRRRMEVQALHTAELEAAMEEAEKQKVEEARRKQMEKKAEKVSLRFGDAVKIHDLVGRKDLNGATGTYLGFAQGDRYTVRLDCDGKEIALKACNFSEWDGKYVPPWSCSVCTFRHEGMLATVSTCNMCGTERTAENNKSHDDGAKAKTNKATRQDDQKYTSGKTMANGAKGTPPITVATKGAKPKGSNLDTEVSSTRNARSNENKAPTRTSQKQQLRSSAKTSVPAGSQAKAKVSPQQENSKYVNAELTSINSFEPKITSVQRATPLPTTVLLEEPRLPSSSDTKEEIAYSDHPGVIAALSVLDLDFEPEGGFEKVQGQHENLDTSNVPASSPIPPEIERAKPIRCKYGASCKNLKRGVEKCKFYHSPEDVIESQKRKNQKKVCRHGLDCEKLKRGPAECAFYHSGEQISLFHPNYESSVAGANSTSKGQASATAGSITASGLGSFSKDDENTNVRRNLKIPAIHAPLVIGKNGKRIQGIIKKSGAQVAITHKTDPNGMCAVHITGNSGASVQMAADLVIEAAGPKVTKDPSASQVAADNSDDLSGLTGDSSSFPTGNSKPSVITPSAGSPSAGSGGDSLLSFLQSQKACFKCPPASFHQFLVREDIVTVVDLAEACEDEDYIGELQDNGLKGFKRGPFLKAVGKAAAETSCN